MSCTQIVHTILFLNYEWDENKAKENIRKHGVDFADEVIALEDENALTIEDFDHSEQRFTTAWYGIIFEYIVCSSC